MTKKEKIRQYLLGYAWLGTAEEKAREVDCIMAQNGWQHIDAVADKYAGAQEEPGPDAFADGMGFALTALYECHDGPHLDTCPRKKDLCNHWTMTTARYARHSHATTRIGTWACHRNTRRSKTGAAPAGQISMAATACASSKKGNA